MRGVRAKSRVKRWRLLLSVELSVLAVVFWFFDHSYSFWAQVPNVLMTAAAVISIAFLWYNWVNERHH